MGADENGASASASGHHGIAAPRLIEAPWLSTEAEQVSTSRLAAGHRRLIVSPDNAEESSGNT